jgi:hypothetical protein
MRTERWTSIAGLALLATVIGGIVFETMGPNWSAAIPSVASDNCLRVIRRPDGRSYH